MITCKEDLVNTYIDNDFGELRDLYIKIALENNVKVCGSGGYDYLLSKKSIGVRDWGFGPQLEWGNGGFENAELVTLSDLKPKPTKFVKVEESIFDLKDEFERGELYSSDCEGHYTQLKCEKKLYLAAHQDSVYRQVEITERDLFIDMIEQAGAEISSDGEWSFACLAASVFDSGHIKLTDKPE